MSFLSNLFKRKSQYLIGVDIGSGFLKITEVDHSHNLPSLTAVGVEALPPEAVTDVGTIGDVALFASKLQQLMLTTGCRSRNVVFSVGGQSTFIREVLYPFMDSAELKEAISWDIEKYIPFTPDSYYYDYSIVGKSDTDIAMRVLIAAAPKAEIDIRMALAKQANCNLVAVDLDALAAGRVLKLLDSVLLVDIGESITQMTVFQGGCPVVARSVMIGGRNFTFDIMKVLGLTAQEAELLKIRQTGLLRSTNADDATDIHNQLSSSVGILAKEMAQTIETYKIQNRHAVFDQVILTGGGANLDNLSKYLEWFSGMPVVMLNPLSSVRSDAFDPLYLHGFSGQLTVAIGLAMWGGSA